MTYASEALEYLKKNKNNPSLLPDLISLYINMPGMNGWEFLEEYENSVRTESPTIIVVMLTTSTNPDDRKRSLTSKTVSSYNTKPLTVESINEIMNNFFQGD